MDFNLKTICAAPHNGLTINQVSAWADVNCRVSRKKYRNFQKGITLLIFGGLQPRNSVRCSTSCSNYNSSFSLFKCKLLEEIAGNDFLIDCVGVYRVGHFVSSPREREKRDRRDKREGQGERRTGTRVNKRKKNILLLPLPATRIAGLAQL